MTFINTLKERVLIGDGAMGTILLRSGLLKSGIAPEILNLSNPDDIATIHEEYMKNGADIIESNSFGGNRIKLKNFGLQDKVYELNKKAAEIAKKVASKGQCFVAGSMGPCGELIKDEGPLSIKDVYNAFFEQAKALADGGADYLLLETFSDLMELKTAAIACLDATNLPVFAQMTFDADARSLTGSTPESMAVTLEAVGVTGIGINCSLGPEQLVPILDRIARNTNLFVSIFPNAGLPYIENGKTIFPTTPESFSETSLKFYNSGANIIGGCCGTEYEHIRLLKEKIGGRAPIRRKKINKYALASRTKVFWFDNESLPPLLIGERLNPTGRKKLAADIIENKFILYRNDAIKQELAGAMALDINVSVPGTNESDLMKRAVSIVQGATECALCLDSSDPDILAECLPLVDGKPLINSINGKKEVMDKMLPLIKKWGAMSIVLCLDENGIPDTSAGRIKIAKKVLSEAEKYGLGKESFIFDALTLTVGSNPLSARTGLETLKILKEKLDVMTSMGVSNVSFGMPARAHLNAAFLSQVISNGAGAVIINPINEQMRSAYFSSCALLGRDPDFKNFYSVSEELKALKKKDKSVEVNKAIKIINTSDDDEGKLKKAVITGATEEAKEIITDLREKIPALDLINNCLVPAMEEVGELYDSRKFFLPQLIKAAETMKECSSMLSDYLPCSGESTKKGKILLATVEGDIHDIGKNLVSNLLVNHGFSVIDLGKDIKTSEMIDRIIKEPEIKLVGLSALMTTTMTKMKEFILELEKNNIRERVKVVIGGAVVTEKYSKDIGADYYAQDAVSGVRIAKEVLS